MKHSLCHESAIGEGESRGFEIGELSVFAVRKHGMLHVYHNRCPHLGINLEWLPDRFLDSEGELIQCATHGALFLIDTGACVAGPCAGQHLDAIAFRIEDGMVVIDTPSQD